ncbi:PREDICTED: uncharacterized protein LOC109131412 [Camelina sativa]|uniref:Uncharacterized protein LOC109131412 n=1 Tax=Camelina sativa TaxID=90675 RepID=A0ABM1RG01_CAMSA|nr:PREDICTED: uncharacterized protein LOC109131412 [Camelina sativa]
MEDGAVEIQREEQRVRRREEIRRLTVRLFVAVALVLINGVCKRAAGFDESSDPNKGTENRDAAFYWASKLNRIAHNSFILEISYIFISLPWLELAPWIPMRSQRQLESNILFSLGFTS